MSDAAELTFHPAANLFPLLEGADYESLKDDIKEHGQRLSIMTFKGQILDGRNRYRCCRDLGIEPACKEWDGNGSAVAIVISLNLKRRHLDAGQRACVAVEAMPMLAAEAKERQRQHGGTAPGKPKSLPGKVPVSVSRAAGESRTQAAKLAKAGVKYVQEAATLKAED